jgi:uncharacterized Ntn-hydrolase superfamily protein
LTALGFADLQSWLGYENFEERDVPGHIDPVVLERLRTASD